MNVKKDTQQQSFLENPWNVYLSGEIHSDWREQIKDVLNTYQVPIQFSEPNTGHSDSDDCGSILLGSESDSFWHDHKGAKVNAIRTRTQISRADLAVIRFGEKYRQWNAAFDAGYATALGKPIITLHDSGLTHALKEVDGAALAVAETPAQVVRLLTYVTEGRL